MTLWGLCPPDPLLQRSTTVLSIPSPKILDLPVTWVHALRILGMAEAVCIA